MVSTTRGMVAALAVLAAASAGCGSDDGGDVRSLGGDASAGSASGSASGSGSGSASAPVDEYAECAPANEDLEAEATETVTITTTDYKFADAEVTVPAGTVTFEVVNEGPSKHELAFLPGGGEVPFTNGVPDEDALGEAGAFELEGFSADQTCNATFEFEPGTYTMFCIITAEDGETHYEKGMEGVLTVT